MESLKKLLATVFDKLRFGNPVVYVVVVSLLLAGVNFFTLGLEEGVVDISTSDIAVFVIEWLIATLTSSRTKRHLPAADDGAVSVHSIDFDD